MKSKSNLCFEAYSCLTYKVLLFGQTSTPSEITVEPNIDSWNSCFSKIHCYILKNEYALKLHKVLHSELWKIYSVILE